MGVSRDSTAHTAVAPPCPQALQHLRPTDRHGWLATMTAMAATCAALWLSAQSWPLWILGQTLLGGALVAWFAILHECGHRTLFRRRLLNSVVGFVAGGFAMIPYRCWSRVHGRHHKWTGWQDLDPTTESLVPRELTRVERTAINVCWRLWIPLFSTMYRVENYWNLPRLTTIFPRPDDRRSMWRNAAAQLAIYVAIAAAVGPATFARLALIGVLLSLIAEDLLLLSQHTHVPQHVSGGANVPPVPALEQEVFTRSLRLPAWASSLLLHVDAHELHHMYPFVPGHHLPRIPYQPAHEVGWLAWVRSSRRLRGEVLLFQNREQTGFQL